MWSVTVSVFFATAFVLSPPHRSPQRRLHSSAHRSLAIRANFASDGEEVDWDKEAAALVRPGADNKYYKAIKDISAPKLVGEFASTAPKDVQFAVKATIGQLLGNLPPDVVDSTITTPGKNLGSLMFSMQMTGYMFCNAEYRKSLQQSLEGADTDGADAESPSSLPPVSGTITVKIAEGMEAQVDAASYMAELRAEVEGLRSQLVSARQQQQQEEEDSGGELLAFMQELSQDEAQSLTSQVSEDVLTAMGQLVSSLLIEMNVPISEDSSAITAPVTKLRELLITQLVTGYKLRKLEALDEIKDTYWGK